MKILVVDDEALVSQYVTQCIQSAGNSNQIIGTATSGAKALRILQETAVDLAFVDITMPKMDGLELLRRIKTDYPATMVVMLTCHDEFEYARQAIQNKADNYILKSEMTPEYMQKVLEDMRHIRKERRVAQQTGHLKQNDYLKKIVEAPKDVYVITEEMLRKHNIFLRDDAFVALCFDNTEQNLAAVLAATEAEYENPVVYPYNEDLTILLLNARSSGKQWDTFQDLYTDMDAYFRRVETLVDGNLGYSRMYFRMAWLGTAIETALEHHNDCFYGSVSENRDMSYQERITRLKRLMTQSAIRMEEGNWEAAISALKEAIDHARQAHADSAALKRSAEQVCAVLETCCGTDLALCRKRLSQAECFADVEAEYVEMLPVLSQQGKQYSTAISSALHYISQHYAEDLTLNMVADHVFLNREYLSRRFKQEVGSTFSEYLTSLRLKQAKELLETSSLRISEVAAQIGIPNISYFSTIFRKEFGCSPSEIRTKKSR